MQRPTEMLENWRNADPVFFTQVGRIGPHPIVAAKGGYTLKRDGSAVDVSTSEPETVDELLDRIDPVVERRGEDDVAIATNAGFAASADLPLMSEEEQNTKLRLVETVARYYWGNEI